MTTKKELTRTQIILLTLLISFLTSVVTSIVTVSALIETPNTAQSIHKILNYTVERVSPTQTLTN